MEHRCPKCNEELQIASSKLESDVGTTDIYSVLTLVCPNPKCDNYAGPDRNNPKVIVKTPRIKVN
ncbi:MAG: hypothetical protein AB9836_06005 [Aminipila sp.]